MKKIFTGICATALAASMSAVSIMPVGAAPAYVPQPAPAASDIQLVNHYPGHRRFRHFRRDGDRAWYRGHRGYRHYRRGHREFNGFWFPLAAFAAGALITGAIDNDRNIVVRRSGSAHVNWCYDRYRSYRAYDNTFQPYEGPRRQCYSPYS